jgi:hypothetical protein
MVEEGAPTGAAKRYVISGTDVIIQVSVRGPLMLTLLMEDPRNDNN